MDRLQGSTVGNLCGADRPWTTSDLMHRVSQVTKATTEATAQHETTSLAYFAINFELSRTLW
jgi:hypothetical protein